MTDLRAAKLNSYVLILRASAGFYFGKDDSLPPMRFLTQTGPTEITFGTSRMLLPGFTHPVRHGIWADVRGEAESLNEAIEPWANWARGVAAILSVAANAPVGNLTADLGFDDTPGKTNRCYWRRTYPNISLIPHSGRKLPSQLALALVSAWMKQPHKNMERWHRAFNAYHHALQEWEPGLEIPSLGHLWVGMEALTPIALNHHLEERSLSRDELAREWNIEPKALNAETRLRLLFDGNEECYSEAKEARNGLLHGYGKLWDVRERSMPIRLDTARYLRSSLFNLIGLNQSDKGQLLAAPFDTPLHWTMMAQMFGTIRGRTENLAAEDDIYPQVEWAHTWKELPQDEEGDARFEMRFAVIPRLAKGLSFELDSLQVLTAREDESDESSKDDS